ncbi:hypothetical protein HK104_003156 [Borealophlyctis nickersoniae]|nr:hypothetical protein HK104_003156 [Borealophlyctis nickersoniae]
MTVAEAAKQVVTEAAKAATKAARKPSQQFTGYVIKRANPTTAKVRCARVRMHPVVQKPVTWHKCFIVHDADNKTVVGDYVRIDSIDSQTKIDGYKSFVIGDIVRPAARYVDEFGKLHTQQAHLPWQLKLPTQF